MTKIRVSLAQIQIQLGQPQANLAKARAMWASAQPTQLFLLPELWPSGYDLVRGTDLARQTPTILAELGQLSAASGTYAGGSLLELVDGQVFNSFYLTAARTAPVVYSKLHLFGLMDEDRYLAAGDTPCLANLPWGRAGLAICYDLRFPELFRIYSLSGAAMILLVAEWPQRRIEHFRVLLRARAIENQVYVLAVNCVGKTGNEIFGGCSAVIDPWGEVIAEASGSEEELLSAEIDLQKVAVVRRNMPILRDRRPDIYGDLNSNSPKA